MIDTFIRYTIRAQEVLFVQAVNAMCQTRWPTSRYFRARGAIGRNDRRGDDGHA